MSSDTAMVALVGDADSLPATQTPAGDASPLAAGGARPGPCGVGLGALGRGPHRRVVRALGASLHTRKRDIRAGSSRWPGLSGGTLMAGPRRDPPL